MSSKKWTSLWTVSVAVILILVFGFNFTIDPYGVNRIFIYDFNKIKKQLDERSSKLELLKGAQYNTFIFGSSRNTIIDPELINNKLTNSRAINVSFGSASIIEIESFFNYIKANHRIVRNIFIPIDLFAFSDVFSARRVKSTEDLVGSLNSRFNVKTFFHPEYLSYRTLIDSLGVIKGNRYGVSKCNAKCASYKKKGMRYYKDFLESKEYDIKKNVTDIRPYWKVDSFTIDRVEVLKRIFKESSKNNISTFIYTNPLTFQQLYASNGKNNYGFFVQLDLIEEIVHDTDIKVYDFNNLNSVNLNNDYFVNQFHFNYNVADCIITKVILGTSACGSDFGELIDNMSIKKYKESMKKKFSKLRGIYGKRTYLTLRSTR
jgi:hypothetical protein